jgi:hypothetical protein
MYVYIDSYVHTSRGITIPRIKSKEITLLGAYEYHLDNGLIFVVPNDVEYDIGDKIKYMKPELRGYIYEPQVCHFIAQVLVRSYSYLNKFYLFYPELNSEKLIELTNDIEIFAKRFGVDNIEYDESRNLIDVTNLVRNLFIHFDIRGYDNFKTSINTLEYRLLLYNIVFKGDFASILEFMKAIYPVFKEMNKGYQLKLNYTDIANDIMQLFIRIGIVPQISESIIFLSRKQYKLLEELINGIRILNNEYEAYGTITKKYSIGLREFVNLEEHNIIAIDGISAREVVV